MIRENLEWWSNLWFWLLIASTIAVAIGVVLEAPEVFQEASRESNLWHRAITRIRYFWYVRVRKIDLNGWERVCPEIVTKKNERHRPWIATVGLIGWTLVAVGVGGEGIAEYFVTIVETDIRSEDEASLSETTREAGTARVSADSAASAATRAKKEADQVTGIATDAKVGALDAKQRVANLQMQTTLLQGYIDSEKAEIVRLKSARSFTNTPEMVVALEAFRGTEYTFSRVAPDEESIEFVRTIDSVLQQAKWVRVKPPPGPGNGFEYEGINPFGDLVPGFSIPIGLRWGIAISYDLPNPPPRGSRIVGPIPAYAQAGSMLDWLLAKHIFPPDNNSIGKGADMLQGGSHTVRIIVGSKPLQ